MSISPLHQKHIVVTGASRGLGRALALEFAHRGARLSLCARSEASLQSIVADTQGLGGVVDVTDSDAVRNWLEAGLRANGPIDMVVNNAAILGPKSRLADYPIDEWRQVMDINVTGLFVVTRAVLPHMSPGGILAHLTSFLGRNALPGFGAYCASKFGVEAIARLVAVEHPELVSLAVDPGKVATDMLRAAMESDDVSESPTPAEAATRFADLLERAGPALTGTTQSLFPEAG